LRVAFSSCQTISKKNFEILAATARRVSIINLHKPSSSVMRFAEALQAHQRWIRCNLPGIDTPPGMALLIWLLQNEGRARPVGRLYKEVRSSEPTMRACVKAFADKGLIIVCLDRRDGRRRLILATPKLRERVADFRHRLGSLSQASLPSKWEENE